jgi:mono/diheme cytochrome c family protein
MKKLSIFFVAGLFITFLAACGGEAKQTQDQTAVAENTTAESTPSFDLQASIKAGEAIYNGKGLCHTCHQANGLGIEKTFPPLAGSDFLLADKDRAIKTTIFGNKTGINVNGVDYPGGMMTPATALTDEEIRDVVNYSLNSWGNNGGSVTTAEVTAQR